MEFLAKLLGTPSSRKENGDESSVPSKPPSEITPSSRRTTPVVIDLTASTPPCYRNAGGVGTPSPAKKPSEVTPGSLKTGPVVIDLTAPTPPPSGIAPHVIAPSPLPPLPQSPAVSQQPPSEFYVGFNRQLVEDVVLASCDTTESPDSTADRSVSSDQHSLSDQSFDTASLGVTASADEPASSHTKADTDSDGADFESADEQSLAPPSNLAVLPAIPKHLNSVQEQLNQSYGLTSVISKLEAFSIESPAPDRVAQVFINNPLSAIFSSNKQPTVDDLDDSTVSDISTFSTQACHGSVASESLNLTAFTEEPSFSALNFLAAAACETASSKSELEGDLEEIKKSSQVEPEKAPVEEHEQVQETVPEKVQEDIPVLTETTEKTPESFTELVQEISPETLQESSSQFNETSSITETPEKKAESATEPEQVQEIVSEKIQEEIPVQTETTEETPQCVTELVQEANPEKSQEGSPQFYETSSLITETPEKTAESESATEPEKLQESSELPDSSPVLPVPCESASKETSHTFAEPSPVCTDIPEKTAVACSETEEIKLLEKSQEESPKFSETSSAVTENISEESQETAVSEKSPVTQTVNKLLDVSSTSSSGIEEAVAQLEAVLSSTPILEQEKESTEQALSDIVDYSSQPCEAETTSVAEPIEITREETVIQEAESVAQEDISSPEQEVATSEVVIEEVKEKFEELKLTEVTLVPESKQTSETEQKANTTEKATSQNQEIFVAEEIKPEPKEVKVEECPEQVINPEEVLPDTVFDTTEQKVNACEIPSTVVESTDKLDITEVKEKSVELDSGSERLVDSFEIVENSEGIPSVGEDAVTPKNLTEETAQVEEIKQDKPKQPEIVFETHVESVSGLDNEKLDIALPEEAAVGGLTELLDLCHKQEQELSGEVPIEDLLAAEAELICQEIHNASLRFSEDEDNMEHTQEVKAPARKSGSPRNHSSPQRVEDPFKPRYRLSSSPSREVGRSSPGPASMSSSGDSAVVSSKMHREGSVESGGSPKSLPSQDSGISGADVNHSEAGPETAAASEEQFVSSADIFKDPNAFEFLSRLGGGSGVPVSRLERESLYVKFDPLVGARDQRKVFLSPCLETSRGENTSVEESPVRPGSHQPSSKCDTPLSHVGTLISIGSPSPPKQQAPPTPANKGGSGDAGGDTPTMHQVAFAQELLERQAKAFEERLERELEKQREQHSREKEAIRTQLEKAVASEAQQASAKSNSEKQFSLVMKEYEDTISTMLADQEHKSRAWATEKAHIEAERKQAQDDLAGAELAFSDLHRKYERAKDAIVGLKSNEEALRKSNTDFQASLEKANQNYQKLKTHAEMQLDKANQEIDQLLAAKEGDQAAHDANVKRLKMQITSLEQSMAVLHREKQELVSICDDLLAKFGPNKS